MNPRIAILSILAVSLTSCSTFRLSQDDHDLWWADDKAQHFGLSAASGFVTTWGARAGGIEPVPAAGGGFTITISAGLVKEWWDATARDGSGWSWKDLAWDLAGTTLGVWAGTQIPATR